MNRRDFLLAAGVAAGGTAASGAAAAQQGTTASGGGNQSAGGSSSGGASTTVKVGAEGNGGNFAFAPKEITVQPGTTVVWEWTGEGGAHNVVAEDGSFDSGEPKSESSVTFKHTFEEEGTFPYYCAPHRALGMTGTVIVGEGGGGNQSAGGTAATGGSNQTGGGNATGGNQSAGGNATGGNATGNATGGNQSASGGGGPTKTVEVGPGGSLKFAPETLTIAPGTSVKFVWKSDGHNVHPKNGNWGHQPIEDTGFTFTTPPFKQTGSQKYWCDPHKSAGMVGTIEVKKGGASSGGGEKQQNPEEMGVPFQAHFVGIATLLMMVVSLIYTFFTVKYGESPNAKGGNN